jgi:hypothetical protein
MAITYAKLRALLDVDEPDYPALAELAEGAMQHVRKLAASPDPSLASKAVSLAGIMGEEASVGVVESASRSRHAVVRVAAAHAATLLPDTPQAARVVSKLLDDKDVGVVKFATRAASRQSDPVVATKARRAAVRMERAMRAMAAEESKRERSTAMAMKKSKKARGSATGATGARKGKGKAEAGGNQMPSGAMTESAKGGKGRDMPTGKMK